MGALVQNEMDRCEDIDGHSKEVEDLSTRFAVRAEENLHFHFSLVSCGPVI